MSEFVTDEACSKRTSEIMAALHRIERRLFFDNGTPSIQTRIDRNERVITTMRRVVWGLWGAVVTMASGVIVAFVLREMR